MPGNATERENMTSAPLGLVGEAELPPVLNEAHFHGEVVVIENRPGGGHKREPVSTNTCYASESHKESQPIPTSPSEISLLLSFGNRKWSLVR